MEDYLRACRQLWTGEVVAFASGTVTLDRVQNRPTPWNRSSVPIWFGGLANALTVRRIVELGDGWLPMGAPPAPVLQAGVQAITDACAPAGRDPRSIGVRVQLPTRRGPDGRASLTETLRAVSDLASAGVTSVAVCIGDFASDITALEDRLAELRALVP